MKVISKRLGLSNRNYYKQHLQIVNAFIPVKLTPKEIDVLSMFMALPVPDEKYRFGTTNRKIVMQELNLSSGGLGNYVKSLKNKGFIDKHTILPMLIPQPDSQQYYFEIKNIDHAE